jgi:beta-glucanase (GH16 family)
MNLFWKKILGILMPTDRYEKLEGDFMLSADSNHQQKHSPIISEYKRLNLELKLSSSSVRKESKKRIKKLKKHPEVRFYLSNSGKKIQQVFLAFNDDFRWNKLIESRWKPGFNFDNKQLKNHYTFENEQQAYNHGRNTSASDGILTIRTKKQSIESLAWHPSKGFVPKKFQYTSDVIQTAASFRQQGGIFKAKIRCSGPIHHAWWLASENMEPHINIFHYNGKEIQMGYVNQQSGDGISITGINPEEFYIYSLHWTKDELIWHINNKEVFRTSGDIPLQDLFMNFNSFISGNQLPAEGKLEVDWVRVYQFNI